MKYLFLVLLASVSMVYFYFNDRLIANSIENIWSLIQYIITILFLWL